MIYFTALIAALGMYLLRRERGATRFFLFAIITGCICSIVGFTIYLRDLQERQLYTHLFWKTLSIQGFFPLSIFREDINLTIYITLMNFGVLLFIYSSIGFAIAQIRPHRKNMGLYFWLAIPMLLEFIIYWPTYFQRLFRFLFSGQSAANMHFAAFYRTEELIYSITSTLNNLYLGAAVILILVNYFQTKRLHYFRAYSLFIATGFTSLVLLFYTLFWWAPKRLISVTTMTDMVHILPVSLFLEGKMLTLFPHFASVSFVFLMYAMYRYNNDYLNYKSIGRSIEKTIDLTGVGISFFSHMVKNYAMATVIDAERLQRKIAEGEGGSRYVERIIASNNELLQRLASVKAKLSIDSLDLERTHISQPMQEALDKVSQEGVQIDYRYDPHTPAVFIDRTHVSEVFYNIIQNAVTAMDKEPRILKIEVAPEKTWVVTTIADTGKGIPKENIDAIFVPFYTTDNSRDSWGLGLSYCYRIMLAHKGKIFVESEVGKGTTFKVLFPITET